ncbi:MAG: hypothetical protein ABJP45_15080 [Cyclobacteriaceae bacterium]
MKVIKTLCLLLSLAFLSNCGSDDTVAEKKLDIPETFTVDIPGAISSNTGGLSGRTDGDGDGFIEGNEIYESLRGFIYVAEQSAEIMDFILQVAAQMEAADLRTLSFTGDVDGREKRIDISEGVARAGIVFDFEMIMVDVESEDRALQLLWNTGQVIGIGVMNPYQIERTPDNDPDTFIRIDYGVSVFGYEEIMQVQISGLGATENGDIDNMSLFVGRNGDLVDIIGNSNHPNLVIIDETYTGGRNYAFVGRGDEASNLGVVNLALPPSSWSTRDYFETHSVAIVLEEEIETAGITDQSVIDEILQEAQSPAYFNADGFITSGVNNKPLDFSTIFTDLSDLSAFVPADIAVLEVGFIQ